MLDCLKDIVGLSTNDCECLLDGRPSDYNVSKSGHFIDDHLNLNTADAYIDCGQGSIWEVLESAKQKAINDFTSDLLARILIHNKLKHPPTREDLGKRSFRSLAPSREFQGIKIHSTNINGGCLVIHNIKTLFNQTGSIHLDVVRVLQDDFVEQIASYTLNTAANSVTNNILNTPLELDLYDQDGGHFSYYLIYNDNNAPQPLDNKIDCNCSSSKKNLKKWVSFNGVYNNTLDYKNFKSDSLAHGLILDIEAKCKIEKIICDKELCFQSNPFAKVMANAINYFAASIALSKIVKSGNINRFTMMSESELKEDISKYRTEYFSRLDYLEDHMTFSATDCLTCGSQTSMKQGRLLT